MRGNSLVIFILGFHLQVRNNLPINLIDPMDKVRESFCGKPQIAPRGRKRCMPHVRHQERERYLMRNPIPEHGLQAVYAKSVPEIMKMRPTVVSAAMFYPAIKKDIPEIMVDRSFFVVAVSSAALKKIVLRVMGGMCLFALIT